MEKKDVLPAAPQNEFGVVRNSMRHLAIGAKVVSAVAMGLATGLVATTNPVLAATSGAVMVGAYWTAKREIHRGRPNFRLPKYRSMNEKAAVSMTRVVGVGCIVGGLAMAVATVALFPGALAAGLVAYGVGAVTLGTGVVASTLDSKPAPTQLPAAVPAVEPTARRNSRSVVY